MGAFVPEASEMTFRPGAAWNPERGRLYEFTRTSIMVTEFWPKPTSWRFAQGKWRCFRPYIDLSIADRAPDELKGVFIRRQAEAYRQIPAPVRSLVRRAALAGRQFDALSLLTRVPQTVEIAEHVPILAGALSSWRDLRGDLRSHAFRTLRAMLGREKGVARSLAALRWLRLPDDLTFLRQLKRARLGRWCPISVAELGRLWPMERKPLQHLPELTAGAVTMLSLVRKFGLRRAVHPDLLVAIGEDKPTWFWWHELERSLEQLMGIRQVLKRPPALGRWCSTADVDDAIVRHHLAFERACTRNPTLCDEASLELPVQLRRKWLLAQSPISSPVHPLSGMRPLDTPAHVEAEGQEMEHCLNAGGYGQALVDRQGYGFAIDTGSERATLWLCVGIQAGVFSLDDLKGPQNAPVSATTRGVMEQWLVQHNAWASHLLHEGARPDGAAVPIPPVAETFLTSRLSSLGGGPDEDDEIPF
jgi:hypothetical protein